HQPEPGVAAASLEPARQIGGQPDALARDPEDRLARPQHVGTVEPAQAGDGPVVGIVGDRDVVAGPLHDTDLVPEMEVDRGRADLLLGARGDLWATRG